MRALTRLRLQFEEDSVLQYCLDLGLLRKERTFSCIMTLKSYSRSIDGFVHRCAIWSKRVSIREGKLIILIFRRNVFFFARSHLQLAELIQILLKDFGAA